MIDKFKTLIFDCDGVILDSNRIKSSAFYEVASKFGPTRASQMREYHQQNGGQSRFIKWAFFWKNILGKSDDPQEIKNLIDAYSKICLKNLVAADTTCGLSELLDATNDKTRYVVSGSYQNELRYILKKHDLNKFFAGVYGSPDSKLSILQKLEFPAPALYIGDSKYDYEVVTECDMDFIFMSKYTEFADWRDFFADKQCGVIEDLRGLL